MTRPSSAPPRVAFFDDRYYEVYGAQENLLLLAERTERHRPVFVTTAEGPLAADARARGIETAVVEAPPRLRRFDKALMYDRGLDRIRNVRDVLRYSRRLDRWLDAQGVDVVMCSSVRASLLLLVTGIRGRGRVLLYAQNSTPMGVYAAISAGVADRVLLIAQGARSTFPRWSRLVYARKFEELASGRDLREFVPEDIGHGSFAEAEGVVEVITVCSITPRKGIDRLIDAIDQVNERGCAMSLTVVGGTSGEESEAHLAELEVQAAASSVDVRFVGWQDDVAAHLAAADIFALASADEGLPGVLLEAMAMGLPCVTTDVGGAGVLVEGARCGRAVALDDRAELVERLEQLGHDRELRARLGAAGRAHVEGTYTLAEFAARFERVLARFEPAA